MKSILFFVTCICICFVVQGQITPDIIKEVASQIDSGNHYIYLDKRKAKEFYINAQQAAEEIQNDTLLANTYVGFAVMDRLEGNYSGALAYHQKALDIHLKHGDQRYIAADYHNIGALFRYSYDYEEAKRYLRKGLQLRESIRDSSELPISYMQIGIVCRRMEQLDSAAYYYDRAYEIASLRKDRAMLVKVNGNRATLMLRKKDYAKSIAINLADIPYLEAEGLSESLSTRYSNIALGYRKLKDRPKAIEYMSKAIEIDERERYLKGLYQHLLFRSTTFRRMKDYESALRDYRKYRKIRDTVLNLAQVEKFTAQKVAFEYEQQQLADSLKFAAEQEKLMLTAESERSQKNLYLLTTTFFFLASGTIWYLFRSQRKFTKLEFEKQQLEADLLQEKLQNTEKEASRIVAENQYRLEQKKNLLHTLDELRKISKDQRIIKELNALALGMNLQLTKEEQNLFFEENIAHFNVSFEEKLIQQFPDLTKGEREMCKLIRMKKSNKDIMNLKGVTYSSISSTRYRIRKKLDLPKGEELEQFLMGI